MTLDASTIPAAARRPRGTRRGWALAGAGTAVVALAALVWPGQAAPGSAVAVVFPPWVSHAVAVQAAAQDGIHFLGDSGWLNVVIVSADDAHALASLYRAGAWSLIGIDSAWGCFGGTAPPPAASGRQP